MFASAHQLEPGLLLPYADRLLGLYRRRRDQLVHFDRSAAARIVKNQPQERAVLWRGASVQRGARCFSRPLPASYSSISASPISPSSYVPSPASGRRSRFAFQNDQSIVTGRFRFEDDGRASDSD